LGGVLAGVGETSGALARCAHVAAIMSAAAFVATLVLLRESHGPEHRAHAATHVRSNRWQIMNRPVLRELLTATFLFVAGIAMFQSTFTVWSATALGVTPRVLGIILGATGVLSVAVQGGAIGPLTRRFGAPRLTRAGAALCTVSLALLVFAHTLSGTYVSLAIMTLGGAVFVPSISTLVAATASSVERGAVLGVFQSASSFGRVAGPFLATVVIRATSVKWPFAVAAAISLGALGVLRLERAADAAGTVAAAQEIVPLSAEDAKS